MKRILTLALAASALAAVPEARAQVTQNICSGSASVCAAAMYTLSGSNSLTIWVYNGTTAATAASPSTLTEIWLFNLPVPVTFTGATFWDWNGSSYTTTNVTSHWTFSGGGAQGWMVGFNGELNGPGGNGGISSCAGPATTFSGTNKKYQTCSTGVLFGANSDYLAFTFTLGGAGLTAGQLSSLNWGFHAQQLADGGSIKCVSSPGNSTSSDHRCFPPGDDPGTPTEVVPEPATMTLLATGLAGLAAASARRRKKEREQQQG